MKKYLIAPALLASMLIATPSLAKVEIEWQSYEDYSDIRPVNESRKRFAKNTFKRIEKYMVRLMRDMPEDQTLSLVVTNLDLAGRVQFAGTAVSFRPGFPSIGNNALDLRIIDTIDYPSIEFSYTLTDARGNVIRSGEEDIKDLDFQNRTLVVPRNQSLRYEKQMLKDWFYSAFHDLRVDKDTL
jgi:hypothetical protein